MTSCKNKYFCTDVRVGPPTDSVSALQCPHSLSLPTTPLSPSFRVGLPTSFAARFCRAHAGRSASIHVHGIGCPTMPPLFIRCLASFLSIFVCSLPASFAAPCPPIPLPNDGLSSSARRLRPLSSRLLSSLTVCPCPFLSRLHCPLLFHLRALTHVCVSYRLHLHRLRPTVNSSPVFTHFLSLSSPLPFFFFLLCHSAHMPPFGAVESNDDLGSLAIGSLWGWLRRCSVCCLLLAYSWGSVLTLCTTPVL